MVRPTPEPAESQFQGQASRFSGLPSQFLEPPSPFEAATPPTAATPRYDVFVRKLPTFDEGLIRAKVLSQQLMPVSKLDELLRALRHSPKLKVASGVENAKANRIKRHFESLDFETTIAPVLTLQEKTAAQQGFREVCPACGETVMYTAERVCPICGAHADKRSPLRTPKAAETDEQQRPPTQDAEQALRAKLEAELRERIRRELEEEHKNHRRPGLSPQQRTALIATLLLATGVGLWQSKLFQSPEIPGITPALAADRLLNTLGPMGAASAALAQGPDIGQITLQPGDSLIASVKASGKVVSLSQALAASGLVFGNVPALRQAASVAGEAGAGVVIPVQLKAKLATEFIQMLARNGQVLRARDVWQTLKSQPAYADQPQAMALLNAVDFELSAWALAVEPLVKRKNLADTLRKNISAIPDPVLRIQTLLQVGVALYQTPSLPNEVGLAFFPLAKEVMNSLTDQGQKDQALADFLIGSTQVMWVEAQTKARAGAWSRVTALQNQLDALTLQSPNHETTAQLQAYAIRLKLLMGQTPEATQTLTAALTLADQETNLAVRAQMLRHLASVGEFVLQQDGLLAALNRLGALAHEQQGMTEAQTWLGLLSLYAEAGDKTARDAAAKRAWSAGQLTPEQQTEVSANALTQIEIAAAQRLSQQKAYSQAEPHILQVTQYLLF